MSERWLISIVVVIILFASMVLVYPLRRNLKVSVMFVPVVFILAGAGYIQWGGFGQWRDYIRLNNSKVLAQQMLKSIKDPAELIEKLKAKLDDSPASAKGWYLLGRLYSSKNENQNAVKAFAKAYQLNPEEEQFAVNYAHSLWQSNKQKFSPEIIGIFDTLLKNNPKQPDALAMLAMNAFVSHAYEDAIDYWQRLLSLAPDQSKEALAIRKAIAKAQEHINLGREHDE